MKELKKLSLKEEVDRQAQKIEEEVRNRDDLDDIKVSEDMETSLFNKIQEYEYDKRIKKVVHRSRKKRRLFLALAAVLILVCGSVITGTGSKSYWKVLMEQIAGDERASHIDVEEMESEETEDGDEILAFNEIRKELGILPVRFGYMPEEMILTGYELDKEQNRAIMFYEYGGEIIRYSMYMNNEDSSHGQTEIDQLTDEYQIRGANNITVDIKEYAIVGEDKKRYVAEFEFMDAQYKLIGLIEKEEFNDIIKNLIFL
ncbi:DUF4367 domain-containing protein [Mediterraneibacter glycyrrhizinilyticus]|uniref:DUF4367 domain-containing protein n=1 Tax=Mediterraneibacter glycyrrhizinilyticus TaxID=342942 RepID=UPI0025AA9C88|nr:DUF4367 domain-containing protein [Mediterraneibacter glycyrrhizinilyticus]MDN0042817.1 DUF4367 domain-containing protein [Mediterraneibacter glycyrrhizinilyticus]